MVNVPKDEIGDAAKILLNPKEKISHRFRALFVLRNVEMNSKDVDRACKAIGDVVLAKGKDCSSLLKHECAYCLGQMGSDPSARGIVVPLLYKVLSDLDQPAIVRHESGEALGAIGATEYLTEIESIANKPTSPEYPIEVKQTCELAAARIRHITSDPSFKGKSWLSPFDSVDPSPPEEKIKDIAALGNQLADVKKPLFERYKAAFALRNIAGSAPDVKVADEAVRQLTRAFDVKTPDQALLRHEIAFVLGQLGQRSEKEGTATLIRHLEDPNEYAMVRHEAAEALGNLVSDSATVVLKKFATDREPLVYESCLVALDLAEYEKSEAFEYATLSS